MSTREFKITIMISKPEQIIIYHVKLAISNTERNRIGIE